LNPDNIIHQRRSVRKFKADPIPNAMLGKMIDAATCAPSASNRQPWRFMILTDRETKRRLADRVQEAIGRAAGDLSLLKPADFTSYSRNFLHFAEAPAVILALCRSTPVMAYLFKEGSPTRARLKILEEEGAVMSVAMAVENMLLSATGMGLATCVMTGPLIAEESFNEILSVPEGWKIACLVCAGFADESPAPAPRKTAAQVTISPPHGG
jgi:nitroreductase